MAQVLKSGKTYTSPQGDDYASDAGTYASIYFFNMSSKSGKEECVFTLSIYKNEDGAKDGVPPYEDHKFVMNSSDYDTYIGAAQTGSDTKTRETVIKDGLWTYLDAAMQAEIDEFDTDGEGRNGIRGNWVWKDWESDV